MRFHTDGGPFVWSEESHEELGYCFAEIGADRGNRVIVFTYDDVFRRPEWTASRVREALSGKCA